MRISVWSSDVCSSDLFADGLVDRAAFEKLVAWQIAEGTHGLLPCGTTGESPTLSHAEHMDVTELCIKTAAGRVPVMARSDARRVGQECVSTVRVGWLQYHQRNIYSKTKV